MSQWYPYPPNEYSTTLSRLPIVSSFVLVSDSAGNNALGGRRGNGEGPLIYDPIAALASRFNGLGGASSELNQYVVEIH